MSKTIIYIPWHKERGYLLNWQGAPISAGTKANAWARSFSEEPQPMPEDGRPHAFHDFIDRKKREGWCIISIPLPDDPTKADFTVDGETKFIAVVDQDGEWNDSTNCQPAGAYKLIDWSANAREEK